MRLDICFFNVKLTNDNPLIVGVHADVSCTYNGQTDLHPFAFRVHAHSLGKFGDHHAPNKLIEKTVVLSLHLFKEAK